MLGVGWMLKRIVIVLLSWACLNIGGMIRPAVAERVFLAGYKDGFYLRSEQEGGMELHLGGSMDVDYRHYL